MSEVADRIAEVMKERLGGFLVDAVAEDPDGVRDVYGGCIWTGSPRHYDDLVATFLWNTNLTWKTHRDRPSNRNLHNNHKWFTENWVWHVECPHSDKQSVALFDPNASGDNDLQEDFRSEVGGNQFDFHSAFVQIFSDEIAPYFRNHPVVKSFGLTGIPILIEIDGDEDFPQAVVDALNPNGEAADIFEPW